MADSEEKDEQAVALGYEPSKKDLSLIKLVEDRFAKMQQSRSIIDSEWGLYQEMLDAIYEPYGDERSSSSVPLATALLELFVAEAMKLKTQFIFKGGTKEHKMNAEAFEYVWKDDWRRQKRDREIIKNEYHTGAFGSSVIYTGYESYTKTQSDPVINAETNEIEREEKTIDVRNIILRDIDIRKFYPDNRVINDFDTAEDCVYRERETYDKFLNLKNNPLYKDIDKVVPKAYSNEYASFTTLEDTARQEGNFVERVRYWNVEKDLYVEIANGILVRTHPMMSTINGVKALPFAFRRLGYKTHSLYGKGFCEGLKMFNSEINDLREMLMDGVRRSNSSVLAIGNGLSFDGREFTYDNEILTFDGQLSNNFQQISGTPPNQAVFSYIERLYKDIAIYIGLDIENIIGTPNRTAFEVEVQRAAGQKRVNVWITNRDMAFERLADLHKDNLQRYYPQKDAKGLYPQIEIEGKELSGDKFIKSAGNHTFEVKPEILRGDIRSDVSTNVTAPTISAVDREQKMNLMRDMSGIIESYGAAQQMGVDLNEILPLKKTLRDLAGDHNFEIESSGGAEDVKAKTAELRQGLMGMMRKQDGAEVSSPNPQEGATQQQPQMAPQ